MEAGDRLCSRDAGAGGLALAVRRVAGAVPWLEWAGWRERRAWSARADLCNVRRRAGDLVRTGVTVRWFR